MLDNTLILSDGQAVTSSAASTNVVDFGGGNLHHGLYLVLKTGTAFATCTSVTPSIQTSDESTFSSPETVATLPTFAVASLTANKVLAKVCLPIGLKKYVRVYYTVAGSNATAGTVTALLTDNPGIGVGDPAVL